MVTYKIIYWKPGQETGRVATAYSLKEAREIRKDLTKKGWRTSKIARATKTRRRRD